MPQRLILARGVGHRNLFEFNLLTISAGQGGLTAALYQPLSKRTSVKMSYKYR
jgi:hypothetical protein